MFSFIRKLGLVFLGLLKPFFEWWRAHNQSLFDRLKNQFRDPYLSGMIHQFGMIHEWIFEPSFKKVHVDDSEISKLKELAGRGTLVYVMKNRGQLEYSFFNHLFLKEGIPLARFANGCRTLFWQPLKHLVQNLLLKLDYYYHRGLLEDPVQSGYLADLVSQGESALLNLKVSRELIFGSDESPVEFIIPLLEAAKKSPKPVYLITQQFLYDRHPEKTEKSFIDLLLGEKSNPGMIRKLILFLLSYRKKATVKFGEALNLQDFLTKNAGSSMQDMATLLNTELLSRLHIERKSITGPALMPKEKLWERLLRSAQFKNDLETLAKETNRSFGSLQKEAHRSFEEIAATINYSYVDLYDRLIHWMVNNIYDGLDLDAEGLKAVKAVAGKHPIVLVPSHKSHIDYLLLSYVFYNQDLTLPHICAGINLNFWPVGRFLRRGGAFFIRRTLEGNKTYKIVLEHYLKTLVHEGYTTEFFIEGTRSRTGKLLKPKMGILAMLMDAYLSGASEEIYFVPISVHYERILEEKSYEDEIRGGSKQKENVTALFGVHRKLRKKYGKVFIRFAKPVSLKNYFDEQGIKPKEKSIEALRNEVSQFAYRLTYNINKVAVVTSTSLVATALLSYPRRGVPEKEVLERIHILKDYVKFKGAEFSGLVAHTGDWAFHEALGRLSHDKLITQHQDFWEKFYTVDDERRIVLDYHKNNSLHFFTSLACFSKILQTSHENTLSLTEVKKRYEMLKTLLRHDFTFSERSALEEHLLKVIDYYSRLGIVIYNSQTQEITYAPCRQSRAFRVFSCLLDNFFESAYLTLLYLKHITFEKTERKKLEASILEKGKLLYLKGLLRYSEALSQFNIRNALQVFEDLGLVKREDELLGGKPPSFNPTKNNPHFGPKGPSFSRDKNLVSSQMDQDTATLWENTLRLLLGMPLDDTIPQKWFQESNPETPIFHEDLKELH